MALTTYPHPGKFEGELAIAELAYIATMDGRGEEYDLGNEGYVDRYTVCQGNLEITPEEIVEYELSADDVAFANNLVGFIVHVNNQGFVSVSWYDKGEEVQMARDVGKLDEVK